MAESTLLELELEDPVCESCGASAKERVISTRDYETQISNHFDVSRCTNCGLVYTAPRPKFEDLLTHFYGNDYLCYESGLAQKLRTAYQGRAFMKKFRGIMYPGGRLLEVGCASGDLLAYVKEHSDWSLYACEPKREIAEIARKRGLDVQPHTLAEADYQDDFFDVVYMSHVIEHVPDVRVTMEKVFRILKPGGLFITEHPDFGGPTRPFFGRYWWGYHLPRHLTHFTRDSISLMLESVGFEVDAIRGCFRPSLLAWSIENCIKERLGLRALSRVLGQSNPAVIVAMFPFEYMIGRSGRSDVMEVTARKP